jgi:hypothetical protein
MVYRGDYTSTSVIIACFAFLAIITSPLLLLYFIIPRIPPRWRGNLDTFLPLCACILIPLCPSGIGQDLTPLLLGFVALPFALDLRQRDAMYEKVISGIYTAILLTSIVITFKSAMYHWVMAHA